MLQARGWRCNVTLEEMFRIAVIADGDRDVDREEYLKALSIRAGVPAFRCYCDSVSCRIQRVEQLAREMDSCL